MGGIFIGRKTSCGRLMGHSKCLRLIAKKGCPAQDGVCTGRSSVYDSQTEGIILGLPLDASLGIMPPGTVVSVAKAGEEATL